MLTRERYPNAILIVYINADAKPRVLYQCYPDRAYANADANLRRCGGRGTGDCRGLLQGSGDGLQGSARAEGRGAGAGPSGSHWHRGPGRRIGIILHHLGDGGRHGEWGAHGPRLVEIRIKKSRGYLNLFTPGNNFSVSVGPLELIPDRFLVPTHSFK